MEGVVNCVLFILGELTLRPFQAFIEVPFLEEWEKGKIFSVFDNILLVCAPARPILSSKQRRESIGWIDQQMDEKVKWVSIQLFTVPVPFLSSLCYLDKISFISAGASLWCINTPDWLLLHLIEGEKMKGSKNHISVAASVRTSRVRPVVHFILHFFIYLT